MLDEELNERVIDHKIHTANSDQKSAYKMPPDFNLFLIVGTYFVMPYAKNLMFDAGQQGVDTIIFQEND